MPPSHISPLPRARTPMESLYLVVGVVSPKQVKRTNCIFQITCQQHLAARLSFECCALLRILLSLCSSILKVGACFWGLPLPEDGKTFDIEPGGSIEVILDNEAVNGTYKAGRVVCSACSALRCSTCSFEFRLHVTCVIITPEKDHCYIPLYS